MKRYLTENQINNILTVLEALITSNHLNKVKELKKKYDIDFVHDRRTNMNLFFMKCIKEIDELPYSNEWKRNLNKVNLFWTNSDHSKGVTVECQPTVINYIQYKGYSEDYRYIQNWETKSLEDYIEQVRTTYKLPSFKISDMIEVAPNYKKYFNRFTKQNADKEALDYTSKIVSIIEDIYKDEILTVEYVKGIYIEGLRKGMSKDEIFDEIHNSIN